MLTVDEALTQIRSLVSSSVDRAQRAQQLAVAIRSLGNYRWVGIYDVGAKLVSIVAWSGPDAPTYPSFPVSKGLTGSAIQQRSTVMVGDVRKDSRYLTTFSATRSEIIVPIVVPIIVPIVVPIIGAPRQAVVGTIDVESERQNAFSEKDQHMLEQCAPAAKPLWEG
jgi:L-methionine (R)-S-oxide reductase